MATPNTQPKKPDKNKIPTQNNIISVIQSITETVLRVYQTVDPKADKDSKEVDSKALKKALKKARADFDEVVKAVVQFEQMKAKVDLVAEALSGLMIVPEELNSKIKSVRVPDIDTGNLDKATYQLCLVLNTPEEINRMLNKEIPKINTAKLEKAIKRIEIVLELPEKIDDIIQSKNVTDIDSAPLESVQKTIEQLFGSDGFVEKINSCIRDVDSKSIKTKSRGFKLYLDSIKTMFERLAKFNEEIRMSVDETDVSWTNDVIKIVNKLTDTIQEISKVKLSDSVSVWIRLKIIRAIIHHISEELLPKLNDISSQKNELTEIIAGLKLLQTVFTRLSDIFKIIKNISIAQILMTNIKVGLLRKSTRRITVLVTALAVLAKEGKDNKAVLTIGLGVVYTALAIFGQIIEVINSIKRGLFFNRRVRLLITSTRLIGVLLHRLVDMADVRGVKRAALNMMAIMILLEGLKAVILSIILLTPLMALFLILSPIIILVTWAFYLVFRVVIGVLAKILNPKILIIFVLITSVVWLMVALGLGLIMLGIVAKLIMDMVWAILGFFVLIIAISILLGLAGMVLSFLVPFLVPVLVVMGVVALIVLTMIFIAGMLWLLSVIELDENKIKENVDKIMSTVLMIITALFETEINDPSSKKSVFTKIINIMGGAIAKIVMALATCVILVATVVSVLCILLIAAMLWVLGEIKLDENKILANVDKVFNTCETIIGRVTADDESDSKKSNRGILLRIVNWTCGSAAVKVIEALLSLAYVFLMFVSIAMVLGIAAMLRLLQIIDLDSGKIMQNVDSVFNICDQIIDRIFAPRGDKKTPSNRGILTTIVSWVDEGLAKIFEAALTIIYLALIMVSIMIVLGIAGLLRAIQEIDLKEELITKKVNTVFNSCDLIISRIFAPREDKENKSKRGILTTIISWVDEGLAKIYEAALTIVYLALILVSVMIVLGIAGLLRAIQEIDLNYDDISSRVNTIFNTCDLIISRVFAPRDDQENPSSRGILVTIISWMDEGLAKVYEAALTIVYLALIMVSIMIVLGIAKLLSSIQNIDLNYEDITARVNLIFDTCNLIINRVFEPKDDSSQNHGGLFGKIIGFFSPGLKDVIDALMTIVNLALIFTAISAVKGIANELLTIQNINIDDKTIIKKVNSVFSAAKACMNRVYAQADDLLPEPKEKGIFSAIVGFFSPGLGDVLDALTTIQQLAAVHAAISAVAGIAKALEEINNISTDLTMAGNKVDEIMDIAANICTRIFSTEADIKFPVPPEEEKSVWGALCGFFFGGKSAEERAIEAAMQKVEQLGVICGAVGALGEIQTALKEIMDANFENFTGAAAKVESLMKIAADVSSVIFGSDYKLTLPEPTEDEAKAALIDMGWNGLKKWIWDEEAAMQDAKKEAAMKLALHRVETLALIASSVGSLKTIMDGMLSIKDFDEKTINVGSLKAKVQTIMRASAEIAFTIFNAENIGSSGGNAAGIKSQIEDVKARVDFRNTATTGAISVGENLKKLIESITFTEEDVALARNRLSSGISAMDEIMSMIDAIVPSNNGDNIRNNCELLDRISKTAHSFVKVEDRDVKNARDITDNYIKFLQQVDKTDFAKLEHTDYMMRAWASISKDLRGDFEGLAKTINEHIQPMLTTLNETMDKVNKCQESIIQELTKPVNIDGTSVSTSGEPSLTDSTQADTTTAPAQGTSIGKAEIPTNNSSSTGGTSHSSSNRPKKNAPHTTQEMLQIGKRYMLTVSDVQPM